MNVILWIVQIALAFLSFSGGAYKIFSFAELAKMPQTAALPRGAWGALGAFEIMCAVLLVVPAAISWRPLLTPVAAAALAVEGLVLSALFARYSLALAATNPLVWTVAIAVMAAFVASGRGMLSVPQS